MVTIGIIVAMESEFNLLKDILEQTHTEEINGLFFTKGSLGNKNIILMKSGIGKVCAAVAACELIKNFKPDYILNSGLAGGISSQCKVLDIVAGTETVYHDVWCGEGNEYGQIQGLPARFSAHEKLLKVLPEHENIHTGLICSGDKFISDAKDLENIKSNFSEALAVDMESAAIAQVCHIYKIPFLSLRIISDNPGIDNHWQQYQNFWQTAPEKNLELIKYILSKII